MSNSIRLDMVDFRYESNSSNVLNKISLNIKSGERIGIIGSTGSGKSTLIDIIGTSPTKCGKYFYWRL